MRRAVARAYLMPRIPIIPPREIRAGGTGSDPEALPPEQAGALQALEARTARIDRELAVSQSWSAAVERLAQAEDAEDGPPPGFTRSFLEEADKERVAMLKILPPDRQGELEQDLLSLRSDFANRAASAEASGLALRRRSGLYRALDGYRNGVTRDPGLFDEAVLRMDSLSTDLGLSEDRLTAIRREVRDVLGNSAIDGIMDDPDRAARVLSDGLFDDALSEVSKTRRLSEAQTEAARRALLTREQAVSGLTAQARQGTALDEAILAAERDGTLAPAEAAHLRQANAKAAEEASLRVARIERVTTATEPFDPSDPEDREAVSAYWDGVSEVHASDDLVDQKERELGFVGRTGILPDGLARKYQGALLSADPTIAVSGATMFAAIQEMNPVLVDGIPEDRLRKAQSIANYASLDLPPERAIELAEEDIEAANRSAPLADLPSAETNTWDIGADPTDVAALDIPGKDAGGEFRKSADSADVLGVLPEAIAAVLAEEGVADDDEAASALTQVTTAALALNLPLDDKTAAAMERLANGDRSAESETLGPAIAAVIATAGRKVLQEALKRLPGLWKRLQRRGERDKRKNKESQPPAPDSLLPRPPLGQPISKPEDEGKSSTLGDGDESLPMRVPFGEEQTPQIGDDQIDAQLRGVPEEIRREVDKTIQKSQFGHGESIGSRASNEEAIGRMRRDGRLLPDQEAHPPYMPDIPVYQAEIAEERSEFVRITGRPDRPEGFWLMPKDTFEKIIRHPEAVRALRNLYAIPNQNAVTHAVPVELPKGTRVRIGAANGSAEWGSGGGVQVEILNPLDDDWFGTPVLLE